MMSNDSAHTGNMCCIEVARIILAVKSDDIDIIKILHPIYRTFLTPGGSFENYQIKINLIKDQSQNGSKIDPHPELVYSKDKFILHFPTGKLIFDMLSRTGEFTTSHKDLVIDLEYSLRILYAYFALLSGGILIHGAGIARNGKGFIFFGPSGIGKSTVSSLSSHSITLNDDLSLIMPYPDRIWTIFSTPFANPGQKIQNISVPLKGMYLLTQSEEVSLRELSRGKALAELISNIPVISGDINFSKQLLTTCIDILREIPIYNLHFKNDPSFWDVITV
jgi:hypothetical protein